MIHRSFGDFVDKKKRDAIRQLKVVDKMLRHQGLRVDTFLEENDDDEPYIFCYNPTKDSSFDGIRIYKIGNHIAFRIQRESKTHPYGKAYPLAIEEMFHDFLTDEDVNEQQAAQKVIESVAKEVRRFFEKSSDAERHERKADEEGKGDSSGSVVMRSSGTDYSSLIFNRA